MAKKRFKKIYKYECSLSGEEYKTTKEAQNPDELLSINAYYELNPDEDDRPQKYRQNLVSVDKNITNTEE